MGRSSTKATTKNLLVSGSWKINLLKLSVQAILPRQGACPVLVDMVEVKTKNSNKNNKNLYKGRCIIMPRTSVIDIIKKSVDRAINRFVEHIITKDCIYTYNCLHKFLYDVIRQNNQELNLPVNSLGSIESKDYTVHQNTVRYRFEIIVPQRPHYDKATFKQILQGYCNQTALSYGVYGLNVKYNNVFSVFIDRLFYDGTTMTIDVIYIDNQNSFLYCKNAVTRDRKKLKNEKYIERLLKLLST